MTPDENVIIMAPAEDEVDWVTDAEGNGNLDQGLDEKGEVDNGEA